jgi:hypothetical protein
MTRITIAKRNIRDLYGQRRDPAESMREIGQKSYPYAGTNRIRFRGFLYTGLRLSRATPKAKTNYKGENTKIQSCCEPARPP